MSTPDRRSAWLRALLPLAALALVAGACAGSSAGPTAAGGDGAGYPPVSQAAASAGPAAQAPGDGETGAGQLPQDGNGSAPGALVPDTRKIVYTGSLELVVDDLAASLAKAKTAVLATGGYVGASQERNDGDRSVATITYRIPAARWDETVDALRGLATKVVGGQTQATEVGDQIVDLEARLRNLRASEQVLVQIAEGTGKVSDLLEVQARISDVRGEIERIDAQRAGLEDQAAYGTLVTTFGTQVVQVQQIAKGWDPGEDVDGALATLIHAAQSIASAAIWVGIVWVPVLVLLALIALVLRWGYRRFAPKPRPMDPISGWGQQG